jgi:peptidoglycan/LPS O-acetylase OafA/YrhL
MQQLDSMRGLAALLVIVRHWCSAKHPLSVVLPVTDPLIYFFVLSGFLITKVLLGCKLKAEDGNDTPFHLARNFYIRRALRVFPLYYVTLFITYVAAVPLMAAQLPWNIVYLSNVYWFLDKRMLLGSHFWSLSVEEQFYLLWGVLIIALPRRATGLLLLILIAAAPTARFIACANDIGAFDILPVACFDALALGSLLSLLGDPRFKTPLPAGWLPKIGLWVGLPVYVFMLAARMKGGLWGVPLGAVGPLHTFFASLFYVWLVDAGSRGFGGPVGRVLNLPALVYLGKISYGLYVLHPFVPVFMRQILSAAGLDALLPYTYWFGVKLVATVLTASLSRFLLEKPAQNLRRFFPC